MAGVLAVIFWIVFLSGLVALLVRQRRRRNMAVETTSVLTRYSEEQVAQIIESAFHQGVMSLGWKSGPGEGKINKIHRNHGNNALFNLVGIFVSSSYETVKLTTTLSFDITPEPNGVIRVDMWTSYYSKASIAGSAGAILRVKRTIGEALAEPDSPQLAQQMYGSQTNIPLDQPGSAGDFPQVGQSYQHQPYDRRDQQ